MVVIAASICTRSGKPVLSRQFREIQRSRVEALLSSFPKLADGETQHTTVETDSVRFVSQPLDELDMVLITNNQSNILQDIDSLHLFAQVVSSICKSLDEREISRNAFELLNAFDEVVNLGYRENLNLKQIETFLEMESHEERIKLIIDRNKEMEASEERKRRAKQLEMQRKEMARNARAGGGGGNVPRAPSYPTYTPTVPTTTPDTYDSYNAEKNRASKPLVTRGKGMQLGKKSKAGGIFDKVKQDFGPEAEMSAPLVSNTAAAAAPAAPASARASLDKDGVHVVLSEGISAKLDREGALKQFEVKGELYLRISDDSLTHVKLDIAAGNTRGAQLMTHPRMDKAAFRNNKVIQLTDTSKPFPTNIELAVVKWKLSPKPEDVEDSPITFRVWADETGSSYNFNVEYEWAGGEPLKDVVVSIPFSTNEPAVSSFDAVYEVTGDSLEWNIGTINDDNATGSFEFEATADSDAEFFPMKIKLTRTKPYVEIDVGSVTLLSMNQGISFSKEVRATADHFEII